jgi:hypothetical protein
MNSEYSDCHDEILAEAGANAGKDSDEDIAGRNSQYEESDSGSSSSDGQINTKAKSKGGFRR